MRNLDTIKKRVDNLMRRAFPGETVCRTHADRDRILTRYAEVGMPEPVVHCLDETLKAMDATVPDVPDVPEDK